MPPESARIVPSRSTSRHDVAVVTPYRLDLTVNALRRLPSNMVDVFTPNGEYVRALGGFSAPAVVRARQLRPDSLTVTIEADTPAHPGILVLVRSMLGVERDLVEFEDAARRIEWLAPLVHRMRGLKPPRYPTLWETFVNTIVFQQVSLQAASAITRRLVMALATPVESDGVPLFAFPSMERVLNGDDRTLRAAGLSAGKLGTLRRVAEALSSGVLAVEMLAGRTSSEAMRLLREIKGIGPWTAAIVLLRGLGRLDVFPPNDSSVAANLAIVGGPGPPDLRSLLDALGAQQGMLYFYLLLAKLESRGEIGHGTSRPNERAQHADPTRS